MKATSRWCLLPLLIGTLAPGTAVAQPAPPKVAGGLVDAHGDPLPPGAVARLGTARLRHSGAVYALAFSPDGKLLASGGSYGTVRLWAVADGRLRHAFDAHNHYVVAVDFTPDGKLLASVDEDGVRLWDVASGRAVRTLADGPDNRHYVAGHFAAAGKHFVTADKHAVVQVWDVATGQEVQKFQPPEPQYGYPVLSADGRLLASVGEKNVVTVWDVATGKQVHQVPPHDDNTTLAALSPDHRHLAAVRGGKLHVWELATGRLAGVLPTRDDRVAFAPDGRTLATGGDSDTPGGPRLWDLATAKERPLPPALVTQLGALAWSADGRLLATGTRGGAIHLWDAATGKPVPAPAGHDGGAKPSGFLPDGTLAVHDDHGLWLWPAPPAKTGPKLAWAGKAYPGPPVLSADGKRFGAQLDSHEVALIETATGRERCRLDAGHETHFALARDGATLATTGDGQVRLWEAATGKPLRMVFESPRYELATPAFTPDGATLIVASNKNVVRFFSTADGRLHGQAQLPAGELMCKPPPLSLTVAPTGRWVAAFHGNLHTTTLLEVPTGRKLLTLGGADGNHCAVSPDGRTLAVVTRWGEGVQLVEAATGQPFATLRGHDGYVEGLVYSRDGTRLATGGRDNTVLLWDVRPGHGCRRGPRPACRRATWRSAGRRWPRATRRRGRRPSACWRGTRTWRCRS
jgi:WD40 repeat protein